MSLNIKVPKQFSQYLPLVAGTILVAVVGTFILAVSHADTPVTANLWIDGDGGNCTPNDSGAAYDSAAACGSMQAAYAKAKSGYTILVKQGTYAASQALENLTQVSGTDPVTFKAEPGASVTIDYLGTDSVSNVEFDDFITHGWEIKYSQNVTLRNVKASCSDCSTAAIIGGGSKHIKIYDAEIGPVDPGDGLEIQPINNNPITSTTHNDDILIDGLFLHDLTRNLDPSAHDDCLAVEDGINMTFKRLKFYNCATQGLYTSAGGIAPGSLADNITVENSWFGPAQLGTNAVNLRSEANNITFRNNTFSDTVYLEGVSNIHFIGNIFAGYLWTGADCGYLPDSSHGTVEFKYNVSSINCGGDSTNKVDSSVRSKLMNPDPALSSNYDLRLKSPAANAPPIDMAGFTSATGCASDDYDRDPRPSGALCDAGADEYTGTTSGGGTTDPGDPSGSSSLLGTQTVGSQSDTIVSQQAEAWPFTATASGTADKVSVYINSSVATNVIVGLYDDSSGNPGSLKGTTTLSPPSAGGWNTATINAASGKNLSITNGGKYWISVLGANGTVTVKDVNGGSCSAKVNATPNNWTTMHDPFGSTGGSFTDCPVSAYITAATSGGGTTKIGDFNSDGVVNIYDLGIFLSKWLSTTATSQDLNSDGVVNIYDLGAFLSHYGT